MFVDSHCHFSFEELGKYENSLPFIESSKNAKVFTMLDISTNVEHFNKGIEFSAKHSGIFSALGIHPCNVKEDTSTDVESLEHYYSHEKVVAVGEVGLDKYHDASTISKQIEIFEKFCNLSKKLNLPLSIHTRNAESETIDVLKKYIGLRGVIHCFSGSEEFAKAALDLGFYISASGIITFKNSSNLRDIFKIIPMNKILLETDAPYLAPVPYRGKSNQSAYIPFVAATMATIKNLSIEEIAESTTNNFFTLFNKAKKTI